MEKGEGGAASKADEGKEAESAAPKEEPVKDEKKPEPKKEELKKEEKPAPAPAPKQEKKESAKKQSAPEPVTSKAPGAREETRVKMSRMRQTIAKRLKETQNTAASLTTFNEIDMTNIMEFRGRWKDRVLKETGIKLGFMSAFSKAAADALQAFPMANASVDGDQIVYRNYADISVAVSTEKGLVTPVLRNVEGMGMIEIEQAIAGLAKKVSLRKGAEVILEYSLIVGTLGRPGITSSLWRT
jgi:2-oxoglutarate dehydrogenase E2 component (dihydrolipoamide succinyltransferase)